MNNGCKYFFKKEERVRGFPPLKPRPRGSGATTPRNPAHKRGYPFEAPDACIHSDRAGAYVHIYCMSCKKLFGLRSTCSDKLIESYKLFGMCGVYKSLVETRL